MKYKINIIIAALAILIMTSIACYADSPANNNLPGENIANNDGLLERDLNNNPPPPDTTVTNPNREAIPDNQNNTLANTNNTNFNTRGLIIAIIVAVAAVIVIILMIPRNRSRDITSRRRTG